MDILRKHFCQELAFSPQSPGTWLNRQVDFLIDGITVFIFMGNSLHLISG
jgi:hypothetical protein